VKKTVKRETKSVKPEEERESIEKFREVKQEYEHVKMQRDYLMNCVYGLENKMYELEKEMLGFLRIDVQHSRTVILDPRNTYLPCIQVQAIQTGIPDVAHLLLLEVWVPIQVHIRERELCHLEV